MLRTLLCTLLLTSPVFAAERDARFLAGLRERRLFETAEVWATERQKAPLSAFDQAELVGELIRTYALHAVNAPPAERDALWAKAQSVGEEFSRAHPKHPRGLLVRVQSALAVLTRGELLRLDYDAAGAAAVLTQGQGVLRDAARRLEDLQKAADAETAARRRTPAKADELTTDELAALKRHLVQQQARAERGLALTFPAGDDNRLAMLLSAAKQLQTLSAELAADDPLLPEVKLDWAIDLRLLGKGAEATAALEGLDAPGRDAALRLQARGEALRLTTLARDWSAATAVLKRGRLIEGRPQPEFDLAVLEYYTARWQSAANGKDDSAAKDFRQKAIATTKFIEQAHGAYWGRRADQTLVAAAPQSNASAGTEVLKRAADNLFLKGQFADAIAAYERGAVAAQEAGDAKGAFELLYKAGLVDQQQKAFAAAGARLRRAATESVSLPQAAEAHLLAAWNFAQASRNDSAAAESYVAVLREHLEIWPDAASADQARLWLGRYSEGRRDWAEAAKFFAAVKTTSPHFGAALAAIGPCFEQEFQTDDSARRAAAFTTAQAYYQSVFDDGSATIAVRRTAAVALARLLLEHRSAAADAEKILVSVREAQPPPDAAWQREADALLIVALAAQSGAKRDAARKLLEQLGDASAGDLLALVDRLTAVANRARAETRPGIAELQLQTVARLRSKSGELKPPQLAALERIEAQALATAGKRTEALAAFAKVAAARPQDGEIQEAYAELLAANADKSALEQALGQWRRVAAKSPPQSPRWYRAKYAVAELQMKLGDREAARQLLQYLLETPPGLADHERPRFEALLKQAGK